MRRKKTGALWIALIGVGTFVAFTILSFAINDPGPFVAGVLLAVILLPIALIVFLAGRIRSRREAKYGARKPRAAYIPPRSRVSTSDDIRAGMARAKAYQSQQLQVTQKKTAAPQSVRRTYQFCVAGIIYRKNALFSVATLNPDYYALENDGPDGWRIYKYTKELPPVALVPEPENEYDPNAIGVYMKGHLIGYVPKNETAKIREIRAQGSYSATAQLTGGPWLSWRDGEKITGEHGMDVTVSVYY